MGRFATASNDDILAINEALVPKKEKHLILKYAKWPNSQYFRRLHLKILFRHIICNFLAFEQNKILES